MKVIDVYRGRRSFFAEWRKWKLLPKKEICPEVPYVVYFNEPVPWRMGISCYRDLARVTFFEIPFRGESVCVWSYYGLL